ncbi:MBL fold metallo-hydrolase, partial [Verrucomicrobiales bacterium]|nr:MBL fold metallo-hydrolase [Verrucomicrobiales bacterium]
PKIPGFKNVQSLGTTATTEIDLGGRTVRVLPKSGHTSSDVIIETSDPKVVWTGDLFFNRIFPNYGDATPPLLDTFATDMLEFESDTIIVPGHGPIAGRPAVELYQNFLAEIRSAATAAHKAGTPAKKAAAAYKLPDSLSDWLVWSPQNIQKAFAAWYRTM